MAVKRDPKMRDASAGDEQQDEQQEDEIEVTKAAEAGEVEQRDAQPGLATEYQEQYQAENKLQAEEIAADKVVRTGQLAETGDTAVDNAANSGAAMGDAKVRASVANERAANQGPQGDEAQAFEHAANDERRQAFDAGMGRFVEMLGLDSSVRKAPDRWRLLEVGGATLHRSIDGNYHVQGPLSTDSETFERNDVFEAVERWLSNARRASHDAEMARRNAE